MRRAARREAHRRAARALSRPRRATCPTSRRRRARWSRRTYRWRVAHCAPHESARLCQQALGLRLPHRTPRHHDRQLHAPTRGLDGAARRDTVHAAALHHDALAAVAQLVAQRHQVHHEVAVGAPQADHRAGRERIEDELRGRRGLHAGRSRQRFRPDLGENQHVARLDEHARRVRARHEPRRRTDRLCARQRRPHELGRTARRDAEHEVRGRHPRLVHRRHTRVHVVLGAFGALHQRLVSAGDHPHHHVGRRAERRRALTRVEHAEPPRGPGTHVDEPPAPAEGLHDEIEGAGQVGAHRVHRPCHGRVLRVQEVDDLERRRDVDALRARVALLGEPRVAVVGRRAGHEGYRMAPKLDVDPNSGQRAQFGMRKSLGLALLLLTACRGGVKLPETIPVPPDVPAPISPAIAPPAVDTPAKPAAGVRAGRDALIAADWPLGLRVKPVAGAHAMVVTSHPLASDVGVDVLRRGGNAVDAAVAVAFALAVVHPVAGNIGGGGFMVVRNHDGTVHALDFREAAPAAARRHMYVDSAGNVLESSLTGHRSVGVPGSVAGLYEAHRQFGHLPWSELVAPAVRLAREGYALDGVRSRQIGREAERLARFTASRAQFLTNAEVPQPGTRFVQADLARTLRLISKSYADTLRANIDPQRATPSPAAGGAHSEGTETTHYSIVDADGNAVSCTTTLNNDFGSAVTVAGAGFLLNDEMDDFMTAPGKPNLFGLVQGEANAIAPGKRMLSAMTPSIVLDPAGGLLLVLGSPGGSRIPTAVYQVISDVIDQEMPLPSAVAAPRLHHQAVPDTLHLERDGFVQAAIDSLEAMGHTVGLWNYKTEVNAIARAAAGWVGVADPRRGGGAAGY